MVDQDPVRIVVEVVSHADVMRLEARDDDVLAEVRRVESKVDGLHRTIYELMEALSNLRGRR